MLGVGLLLLLSNGKGSMQVNFVTVAGCLDNVEAVFGTTLTFFMRLPLVSYNFTPTTLANSLPRHVADIGFKRFNSCHGIRHTGELVDASRVCDVVA